MIIHRAAPALLVLTLLTGVASSDPLDLRLDVSFDLHRRVLQRNQAVREVAAVAPAHHRDALGVGHALADQVLPGAAPRLAGLQRDVAGDAEEPGLQRPRRVVVVGFAMHDDEDVVGEIVGLVGNDGRGRMLVEMLQATGVRTTGVIVDDSRPTTEKTRMISGVQQVLRVDYEVSRPASETVARRLLEGLEESIGRAGAVILSDYGKGVLTREVLAAAIEIARRRDVPVLVDPKGSDYSRYKGASLITPSDAEAAAFQEAIARCISFRRK